MRSFIATVLAVFALATAGGQAMAGIALHASGRSVIVIDGDTLQLDGRVIQLAGIDAPELGQLCTHDGHLRNCGLDAADLLHKLVVLQTDDVNCEAKGDAILATCLAGGEDLAEILLESGAAVALADSPLDYRLAERRAREAELGLWNSDFVMPAAWRAGERLAAERAAAQADSLDDDFPWRWHGHQLLPSPITRHEPCLIKAVGGNGAFVYYGPLDPGYADLPASARRFCSDDAARAAGNRHVGEKTTTGHHRFPAFRQAG